MESAYHHGVRRILIINGHGGNIAPIQVAAVEAMHELHGLEIRVGNWWRETEVAKIMAEAFPDEAAGHADAGETSVVMAIRPDVVHLERAAYSPGAPGPGILTTQVFLKHYPHGVIGGDPRLASSAAGDLVLAAAVRVYEEMLQNWT
jgi:creatinine amidohydrolase